jgi:hypothetical protein
MPGCSPDDELADAIATRSAPLAIKATLASAHRARLKTEAAGFARLDSDVTDLLNPEDRTTATRSAFVLGGEPPSPRAGQVCHRRPPRHHRQGASPAVPSVMVVVVLTCPENG